MKEKTSRFATIICIDKPCSDLRKQMEKLQQHYLVETHMFIANIRYYIVGEKKK
jgi:hypothetical protein